MDLFSIRPRAWYWLVLYIYIVILFLSLTFSVCNIFYRLAATSDEVYQLLAHGRWFSPGTPASSTTKTGCHDIAEILLKVALSTINQSQIKSMSFISFVYRKSGNFGHGFILASKYEVPKLNTPKYVTLQKLTTKIEHCLNIFLYLYSLVCIFLSYFFPK